MNVWQQRPSRSPGRLPCLQVETAQQRGEYSPPGLLNLAQFRHAWKKLSVRVSEEQAAAIFVKYGCDTQVCMRTCVHGNYMGTYLCRLFCTSVT